MEFKLQLVPRTETAGSISEFGLQDPFQFRHFDVRLACGFGDAIPRAASKHEFNGGTQIHAMSKAHKNRPNSLLCS